MKKVLLTLSIIGIVFIIIKSIVNKKVDYDNIPVQESDYVTNG